MLLTRGFAHEGVVTICCCLILQVLATPASCDEILMQVSFHLLGYNLSIFHVVQVNMFFQKLCHACQALSHVQRPQCCIGIR